MGMLKRGWQWGSYSPISTCPMVRDCERQRELFGRGADRKGFPGIVGS